MKQLIRYFKDLYDFYLVRHRLRKGKIITLDMKITVKFLEETSVKAVNLLTSSYVEDFQKKYKVCVESKTVKGYVDDDFVKGLYTICIYLTKSPYKSVLCKTCHQMTIKRPNLVCTHCLNYLK